MKELVLYFLKLGSIGFGGPAALVGYMQRDLIEEKKWFTKEDYLHGVAFSQLLPGPLAGQLAIYFGYRKGKILGATLVGIAFLLPAFLMVLGLSYLYVTYKNLAWINGIFYGMSAAIIAIVVRAAWKLAMLTLARQKGLWALALIIFGITVYFQTVQLGLYLLCGFIALFLYAPPKNIFRKQKVLGVLPLELFYFFFKAALSVFGGGIALLPYLYSGVVEQHHWITQQQFLEGASIGMITPGPFLISVGFFGYLLNGFRGASISVFAIFLPVWIFVVVLLPWYHKIAGNTHVKAFVTGITAAVAGAIAGSAWLMGKTAIIDYWTAAIALTTFLLIAKTKIPDVLLILAAGGLGLVIKGI